MGELTVTTFVSLDGVMQAPGGPTEDPSGGFPHGGWLVPFADAGMGEAMDAILRKAGAFLFGRTTYDIFAAHWPRFPDPEDPVAKRLNSLPKHIASRTKTTFDWNNSTHVADVVKEVPALKKTYGGELQVHGSAGLLQTLIRDDLVDEYRILTFPVVLGRGKRLFGEGAVPAPMKLVDSRTTEAGTVISTYRRAGTFTTGSFALDDH